MMAALAAGTMFAMVSSHSGCCMAAEMGANLIQCSDFAQDDDISPWYRDRGSAVITAETGVEPVYGDVVTYGKITGRTSNYECFSQDVTGLVEKDKDYYYSFYVMLDSADYADAPTQQRCVEISLYHSGRQYHLQPGMQRNGEPGAGAGCVDTFYRDIYPFLVRESGAGGYTDSGAGN